jgi:large subunit ribosomal protein L3
MTIGLLAEKIGMTQLFLEDGLRVPVTVLQVARNVVVQKKTQEKDGYLAVQVGAGEGKPKQLTKADLGHFTKHNVVPTRSLVEFRLSAAEAAKFNTGDLLNLALLKDAKSVDVAATSKGKGTAGVMKRHHMKGFRATHGTHEYFRHGGSIGMRATPGKVHPGKRMSGRMGNERVTTLNLAVVQIDEEKGLLFVRGAVPGAPGGLVEVRASTHSPSKGRALREAVQIQSKNPMKASKAGGGAAKPKK